MNEIPILKPPEIDSPPNDCSKTIQPTLTNKEIISDLNFLDSQRNNGKFNLEMEIRILCFLDKLGIEAKSPLEKEFDYYERKRIVSEEKTIIDSKQTKAKKDFSLSCPLYLKRATKH